MESCFFFSRRPRFVPPFPVFSPLANCVPNSSPGGNNRRERVGWVSQSHTDVLLYSCKIEPNEQKQSMATTTTPTTSTIAISLLSLSPLSLSPSLLSPGSNTHTRSVQLPLTVGRPTGRFRLVLEAAEAPGVRE